MLSMKEKLKLMQWVVAHNGQDTTVNLVDEASESIGTPVTTADLKEACKNAEIKWSSICSTGTSPVALLHIKVAQLLKDVDELKAEVARLKSITNENKLVLQRHQTLG